LPDLTGVEPLIL